MPHTLLDRFSASAALHELSDRAAFPPRHIRRHLSRLAGGAACRIDVVPLCPHSFCDRLCWFCACHTKHTRSYEPIQRYLAALLREIETIAGIVGPKTSVSALHFGGGSPTLVSPVDIVQLCGTLRSSFRFLSDAEISVEIDPNDMDDARFDALAAIGMTRASLGVQDFEPAVQRAINREQSFETTRWVVDSMRSRGAASVNLDVLYGLPHQTVESVAVTMDQVLSLSRDRIALFGYAHVPWFKKHQTMIDGAALPDAKARFAQSREAAARIVAAGFVPIGLDHFAKPSDGMAAAASGRTLSRNFQGYTVDGTDALIGLGASSIDRLPQGHVQNMPATGQYEQMAAKGELTIVRGVELSPEDRVRGWVIERLMCDLGFSRAALLARFGRAAQTVIREAEILAGGDRDGIFLRHGDVFAVADHAKPFVRSVAARFDAYLANGKTRHSAPV